MTSIIRPKYQVVPVPQDEVPPRKVRMYEKEKFVGMDGVERYRYVLTEKEFPDKEPHFDVYNLKGSSLRIRGVKELTRLGYNRTPALIEEDTITGEGREISLNLQNLANSKANVKAAQKALREGMS